MKQHILVEQLNELSEKGKEKLRKWWKPSEGDKYWEVKGDISITDIFIIPDPFIADKKFKINHFPLLSIGQMIEFLDEHKYFYGEDITGSFWLPGLDYRDIKNNMIDFLWGAMKEVLEK